MHESLVVNVNNGIAILLREQERSYNRIECFGTSKCTVVSLLSLAGSIAAPLPSSSSYVVRLPIYTDVSWVPPRGIHLLYLRSSHVYFFELSSLCFALHSTNFIEEAH